MSETRSPAPYPPPEDRGKEDPTRRIMLRGVALLSGVVALMFGWPLAAYLVTPSYRGRGPRFYRVAKLDDIPTDQPTRISFQYVSEEGYIRLNQSRDVWVIKHSDTDITVYSPICTHLACRFEWHANSKQFVCPCHGSVFTENGKVLAGPAPRPLDTLVYKIENGELYVQWETFRSGVGQKVPT